MNGNGIPQEIAAYDAHQLSEEARVCSALSQLVTAALPDAGSKIGNARPVWFLDGNPIVGYSRLKAGIRLMFRSGADFGEAELEPGSGKFKDASRHYRRLNDVDPEAIAGWLGEARTCPGITGRSGTQKGGLSAADVSSRERRFGRHARFAGIGEPPFRNGRRIKTD